MFSSDPGQRSWTQVHADLQPCFASLAFADGSWYLWGTRHSTGSFFLRRSKQEDWAEGRHRSGARVRVPLESLWVRVNLLKMNPCDANTEGFKSAEMSVTAHVIACAKLSGCCAPSRSKSSQEAADSSQAAWDWKLGLSHSLCRHCRRANCGSMFICAG